TQGLHDARLRPAVPAFQRAVTQGRPPDRSFPANHRAAGPGYSHPRHAVRLRPIGGGAGGRRPAGPAGARSTGGSDRRPRAVGAMSITHVFFDVGGVLGTNGWDQHHRAAAAQAFGRAAAELHRRHEEAVTVWETGGMSLDEYLEDTVFHRARPVSREEFRTVMRSQGVDFPLT